MTERPILFSGPMVNAILRGDKTQTRRVMKPQPSVCGPSENRWPTDRTEPYFDSYCSEAKTPENPRGMSDRWCWWTADNRQGPDWIRCPYGVPGDRLWVRETLYYGTHGDWFYRADDTGVQYARKNEGRAERWMLDKAKTGAVCTSIHMPHWASRLVLEVLKVRAERLQEISESDCCAEMGLASITRDYKQPKFAELWDHINGERAPWSSNPFVWVIDFKKIEGGAK